MARRKKLVLGKEKPCKECPLQNEESCIVEKRAPKVSLLINNVKVKTVEASETLDALLAKDINSGMYYEDESKEFPFVTKEENGKAIILKGENGDFFPINCPLIANSSEARNRVLRIIGRVRRYTSKYIHSFSKKK